MAGTVDPQRLMVARSVAAELEAAGAVSVILTGSTARGEATRHSDIDLVAVGAGPEYSLGVREAFLVSTAWATETAIRKSFTRPSLFGTSVPGWREAVILHDPGGIALALQRDAQAWTLDTVSAKAAAWVAEEVAGHAEEVGKIADAERWPATEVAILIPLLVARMGKVMAVHLGLLYGSERQLWDVVAAQMGEPWRQAQEHALGLATHSFPSTGEAALTIYALTARATAALLTPPQREVVSHALATSGRRPL